MLETIWQDMRYALRGFRRTPGFTAAALMTLTVGIGATSAIFSVVYSVLLRPLPFPRSDELVMLPVRSTTTGPFDLTDVVSPTSFLDWQSATRAFRDVAAFSNRPLTLTGHGEPELLTAALVTPRFFDTLQVRAASGRTFSATDGASGRDHLVVLSDALWRRRFAADPAIAGRPVTLDGETYTVAGVMPRGFTFPEEVLGAPGRFRSIQRVDLWALFIPQPGVRGPRFFRMIVARLIVGQGLAVTTAGLVAGLGGAMAPRSCCADCCSRSNRQIRRSSRWQWWRSSLRLCRSAICRRAAPRASIRLSH